MSSYKVSTSGYGGANGNQGYPNYGYNTSGSRSGSQQEMAEYSRNGHHQEKRPKTVAVAKQIFIVGEFF